MDSQCEPHSVSDSAFTMSVQDLAPECDGGWDSEGETSGKEVSSRSVQGPCMLSNYFKC